MYVCVCGFVRVCVSQNVFIPVRIVVCYDFSFYYFLQPAYAMIRFVLRYDAAAASLPTRELLF